MRRSLILWSACAILSQLACKETLPPYSDPVNVFDGRISTGYVLLSTENAMKVYITVKNIYDETFQAPAKLEGNLAITLARNPSIMKTDALTAWNIVYARSYDARTRTLTLDPGDSIVIVYSWNFLDDSLHDLRKTTFQYIMDPSCSQRCLAYTENFIIQAVFVVYAKTDPVQLGPVTYSLCYVTKWVPSNFCPPIVRSGACNVGPSSTTKPCYPF